MSDPIPIWKQVPQTQYQRFRRDPLTFIAQWLHSHRPKRALDAGAVPPSDCVSIVCISDTHNTTPQIPGGDILLHAGDLTNKGTFEELQAQLDWLASLPHRHKVVIAGNHDRLLDADFVAIHPERIRETPGASRADLNWYNILYLNDSSTTINLPDDRSVTIFGSPQTPFCGVFAFQYSPAQDIWKGRVPPNTDILLTHGPPQGYLDVDRKGCPHLMREISKTKPRLVIFGHIHEGRGRENIIYGPVEQAYQTVMSGDGGWPVIFSMSLAFLGAHAMKFLPSSWRPKSTTRMIMVNAALGGAGDARSVVQLPMLSEPP